MSSTLEIRCHHCGAGFRLTVRRKRPSAVPCRKCGHEIAVPEESTVRSISHAEIFGTPTANAQVAREAESESPKVVEESEDFPEVEVKEKPLPVEIIEPSDLQILPQN